MSESNKPGNGSPSKRILDRVLKSLPVFRNSDKYSTPRAQSPMPAVTQTQSALVSMGVAMARAKPLTTHDTIQLIIKDLNHAKTEALKGQWHYTNRDGQKVIVVECIGQLLNGIEDYARIVDVAIQHQPEITALVWAGVRFILQVARNHVQSMELLEWTMATVITKMANCEFYAQVYANSLSIMLQSKSTTEAFQENMELALQQLYDALLEFSTKAKEYFDPNCFAKKVGNSLKPFSALVKPLLDKITEKERAVQQYAEMATMQRIMRSSNDLGHIQSLLGNIEKKMGPLTNLDDILHFTQENLSVTRKIENTVLESCLERVEQHQRQTLFKESTSLDSDLLQLKEDYLSTCNLMEEFQRDLYVPVQGILHPYDKESRDLEELVRDFLKKESFQKVCLIQGSAGAGKSTFNHYLARQLWKEYDDALNPADAVIPLFISLARLYRPGPQNEDVDLITTYFKERDFDEEQIKLARRTRQFIFILDGYDEISKRDRNFYTENKLQRWKAKVIITSRPEYLDPGYHSKFYPPGQQSLLQEFWITAFSSQAIQQYIVKYTESSPEGRSLEDYQQMVSHPEVRALISNPFLLRMVMTLEPTLGKGPLKRGHLYEQFIEHWLSRAQARLDNVQLSATQRDVFVRLCQGTFTKHVQLFCEEFALTLYRHKILEATGDYTCPDTDSVWQRLLSNDDEKIRLLRFSSPLIRQRQSYRFLHKSVRDYLVAQAIWNDLALKERTVKERTVQALLNEFYLVDDPGIIDFIVEKSEYDQILQQQLLAWVERSKTHTDDTYAAANAISILVRAGMRFTGQDLRGIHIPGADLSFGWFDRAQLQKADLQQVRLRGAWLRGSNLEGAKMDGVQFGERPFFTDQCGFNSLAFSPDGQLIASASDHYDVQLWSVLDQELVHTFSEHTDNVCSVAFSPGGQLVASAGWDYTIRLWSVPHQQHVHTFSGHTGWVLSVAFSPDSQLVASASDDSTVQLWSVPHQHVHTFSGHTGPALSLTFPPKCQLVASASNDNTVRLWSVSHQQHIYTFGIHTGEVQRVAFSPDGQLVVSAGDDKTIQLWLVPHQQHVHTFSGHTRQVQSVAFSPDGQLVASASNDQTVQLWSVLHQQHVHTFSGHTRQVQSVAFSPDGQLVASASLDQTVQLWSVPHQQHVHTFSGHEDLVLNVTFSPDGQLIASTDTIGLVLLWLVQERQLLTQFDSLHSFCHTISWPKEELLATSGHDKILRLWELKRRIEHQPSSHITGIDITCQWASAQTSLAVEDMQVHDVTGLDPINAQLLIQRGAIGVPGYESDAEV